MYINFMCSDFPRILVKMNGQPFWNAAKKGTVDADCNDIVSDLMALIYDSFPKGVNPFHQMTGIQGITYCGVLNQPDSLPPESYDEQDIFVLGEWLMDDITAAFSVSDTLEQAASQLGYLLNFETQAFAKTDTKPIWPLVREYYQACVSILLSGKGSPDALVKMPGYTEVLSRMTVLDKQDQTRGAYYAVLEINKAIMDDLRAILKALSA